MRSAWKTFAAQAAGWFVAWQWAGEVMPKHHGYAWTDWNRCQHVSMVFPINRLAAWARSAFMWIRHARRNAGAPEEVEMLRTRMRHLRNEAVMAEQVIGYAFAGYPVTQSQFWRDWGYWRQKNAEADPLRRPDLPA